MMYGLLHIHLHILLHRLHVLYLRWLHALLHRHVLHGGHRLHVVHRLHGHLLFDELVVRGLVVLWVVYLRVHIIMIFINLRIILAYMTIISLHIRIRINIRIVGVHLRPASKIIDGIIIHCHFIRGKWD